MMTLWNWSAKAEDVLAIFYYGDGSGHYTLPVHLEPQASTTIDVAMLESMETPDADGNINPTGVTSGSVVFSNSKGVTHSLRLTVNAGTFNVTTGT